MCQDCLILLTSISIVKIDPSTLQLESRSHDTSHFFSVSFFVFKQKGVLAKHRWLYSTPHTLLNALIMSNSYNILEMYDEITENLRIRFSVFLLSICFIEDVIAEGDKVATRYTNHGTHQQELMGIPPTGKQMTVRGIVITRFADGKAVEVWNNADDLGMVQWSGVITTRG